MLCHRESKWNVIPVNTSWLLLTVTVIARLDCIDKPKLENVCRVVTKLRSRFKASAFSRMLLQSSAAKEMVHDTRNKCFLITMYVWLLDTLFERNFMTDSHSYDVWRACIPLVEKQCSLCTNWKKNSSISDRYYLLYVIYQLILGSHFGMGFFDFCVLFYQLFTLSWPLQHLSSLTWLYPLVLLLLKMNSMKVALSHCCCSTTVQCHRVVLNKRKWFFLNR